jgi:hypothetical protein
MMIPITIGILGAQEHVLAPCTGKAVEHGEAVRAAPEAFARGLSRRRQPV